jgi:putative transposase
MLINPGDRSSTWTKILLGPLLSDTAVIQVVLVKQALKKSSSVLRQEISVKYAFIERHRCDWPVSIQCSVLDVSARGFQKYLRRKKMPDKDTRRVSDIALLTHIKAIHAETRGAYGWPRIWRELRQRGVRVGKERVRKMMRDNDIRARSKRK